MIEYIILFFSFLFLYINVGGYYTNQILKDKKERNKNIKPLNNDESNFLISLITKELNKKL